MTDPTSAPPPDPETPGVVGAHGRDRYPGLPNRPRWLLPLIGGLIVTLIAANNIGNAVWASWVQTRPIALIALNSTNKYLIATSINAPFLAFVVVATLRLLAPDPLFYAIGFLYGDRALRWASDVFPGIDPLLEEVRSDGSGVRRLLNVLVVVMPNNPVCLIAGVVGFPVRRFIVLNVIGTVGRVLLMWWIGHLFSDQIESLLDVVARYQRWFLLGSVVLVVGYLAWQAIGRRGLIGGVEELDEELGDR